MLGAMLIAFASCFFAPERPGGQGGGSDAAFDSPSALDMLSGGDALMGSGECPFDDMNTDPDPCGSWGTQDVAGTAELARCPVAHHHRRKARAVTL